MFTHQVLELAKLPVPLEPIQQAVVAAMELDESQQLQELQVLLSQSKDYANAGDPANVLYCLLEQHKVHNSVCVVIIFELSPE